MTRGLDTNPHLPCTTGILGNCTALSNTLHTGLPAPATGPIVIFSTIKHCVAILPAAAGSGESIAHSMHTLPVKHTQVGKASIHLTAHCCCHPLEQSLGGHNGLANSCDVIRNNILGSCLILVVEMGSRQSHPIHLLSLAEQDHCW
jgi:hypothetical protein